MQGVRCTVLYSVRYTTRVRCCEASRAMLLRKILFFNPVREDLRHKRSKSPPKLFYSTARGFLYLDGFNFSINLLGRVVSDDVLSLLRPSFFFKEQFSVHSRQSQYFANPSPSIIIDDNTTPYYLPTYPMNNMPASSNV